MIHSENQRSRSEVLNELVYLDLLLYSCTCKSLRAWKVSFNGIQNDSLCLKAFYIRRPVLVLDVCRGGFRGAALVFWQSEAWWRTVKIAEILVRRVGGTYLSFISSNAVRHICFLLDIHFQYQFKKDFKIPDDARLFSKDNHRTAQNESHDEKIHLNMFLLNAVP